jgi:hypothetical protein
VVGQWVAGDAEERRGWCLNFVGNYFPETDWCIGLGFPELGVFGDELNSLLGLFCPLGLDKGCSDVNKHELITN